MMQDQRHGTFILSRTMRPRLECGPAYGVLHSNDGLPFVLCLLAINPPLSAFRYLFGVKPLDQNVHRHVAQWCPIVAIGAEHIGRIQTKRKLPLVLDDSLRLGTERD